MPSKSTILSSLRNVGGKIVRAARKAAPVAAVVATASSAKAVGVADDLTGAITTGTTIFTAAVALGLSFIVWRIGKKAIGHGV